MNSILIAMFVFVCGLVFLLMHQISRLMQMQDDLSEQLDDFHKCTFSRLNDIDRNIGILHIFLEEYTDTILEIMKNTILDMNEKMNMPTYGGEVNDTEEVDLIPEQWATVSPTLHIHYTEDENM